MDNYEACRLVDDRSTSCGSTSTGDDAIAWRLACPCAECQAERFEDATPVKACQLLTNAQACYRPRHATGDSLSCNRLPASMARWCQPCAPGAGSEGREWQVLAYPHCQASCSSRPHHCQTRSPSRPSTGQPAPMPYGLPRDSYDVRKRADWLSVYIDEMMRKY